MSTILNIYAVEILSHTKSCFGLNVQKGLIMFKTQRFCLEKIYCAPSQDKQFNFSLIRINNINQRLTGSVTIYNSVKTLPNTGYSYNVFVIGNLNPSLLNFLAQQRDWFKDVWVKVSDDMVLRNYVVKVYNDKGVIYPREHIYYSFINENSIIIALESNYALSSKFDINSFKFIHVYSNNYFNSVDFNTLPVKLGIQYSFINVFNNTDKVSIQNKINSYESNGGKALIYVNGYYTDNLNLNIPNNSLVEMVYDQSIISKEKFIISDLVTFSSVKDTKLKYLLFRDKMTNTIQYQDDNEIYISNTGALVTTGLYFYQHNDYAVRNVTDKDYSLYSSFVNNTAQAVTDLTSGALHDKTIVLYVRKSGITKQLIYSSLKLHELYKLPQSVEKDVLSNTNYTLNELRAEALEDSDYFKVASLGRIKDLTKELASSALGYNGITYYFANTPTATTATIVNVPDLYQDPSTAFEYDASGNYLGNFATSGPLYPTNNPATKYIEFLYGQTPVNFGRLYSNAETVILLHNEYRILSAYFNGVSRLTNWEDITNNTAKCVVTGNSVTFNEAVSYKIKIVYLNQPNIYNLQLSLVDGILYFPLTISEAKGTGIQTYPIDVPYTNIELYLNGSKLIQGLGYFINFPYVCITDKQYIDHTKQFQDIHIRMYGFTLDVNNINSQEISGFVNNGVLLRNNSYDIREDKVSSVYIRGKMYDKSGLTYAEEDNSVRLSNPLNGAPYVIKEPFIPVKSVSGIDTYDMYLNNIEKNKRISNLFNLIYPEPGINNTNIIPDHYYTYSPTVAKIIADMLDGNIPSSLYQNFNDQTIVTLLDTDPYKSLLMLDPIKHILPENGLVEIHPTIYNVITSVNIFQYRFISGVIKLITQNQPNRINISGYLLATA